VEGKRAMYLNPTYFIFMIPGLLLMLWAQSRVQGAYKKYGAIPNTLGLTGEQTAERVLQSAGLGNLPIKQIPGDLTDHYDPRDKTLSLSQGVYSRDSIAAMAVAAHESGHAMQDATGYTPLKFRSAIVPAVGFGSNVGYIVLIGGLLLQQPTIAWIGVALFGLATIFTLVTLPVEFNASSRAKAALQQAGLVTVGEAQGVNDMLNAAAWTYVASFASSLMTLLYYISLVGGMSGRRR
jgi:uncharacterized protein